MKDIKKFILKKNIIKEKSFEFSLKIIEFNKILKSKKEFTISDQLLRSSTSIGANVQEADNAGSKKDFLAKIIISYKEANEAMYWLKLIQESKIHETTVLIQELHSIIKILKKIIKTTKQRLTINDGQLTIYR